MKGVAIWGMTLSLVVPLSAPSADVRPQDPDTVILLVSNSGDPADPDPDASADEDAAAAGGESLPPAPIYRIPKGVGKERSTIGSGRRGRHGGRSDPAKEHTPPAPDSPE